MSLTSRNCIWFIRNYEKNKTNNWWPISHIHWIAIPWNVYTVVEQMIGNPSLRKNFTILISIFCHKNILQSTWSKHIYTAYRLPNTADTASNISRSTVGPSIDHLLSVIQITSHFPYITRYILLKTHTCNGLHVKLSWYIHLWLAWYTRNFFTSITYIF